MPAEPESQRERVRERRERAHRREVLLADLAAAAAARARRGVRLRPPAAMPVPSSASRPA